MLLPKGVQFAKANKEVCEHCGGKGWLPTPESLRTKREKAGLTLTAVADEMGMPKSRLSSLEQGRHDWNAGLLERFLIAIETLKAK